MPSEFSALAGRRILAIDDFVGITSLLKDLFEAHGASVVSANTGASAMLLAQMGVFDLVILDLVMPRPNGWDVLELLRRQRPELLARTIVLTGNHFNEDTVRRIAAQNLPAIYKPFDLDDLRRTSCEVLSRDHIAAA